VVLGAASAAAPLTVDLTGVRYLSSAGVALIAEVAALAGDGLTVVVAAGSAPARICALTGILAALPVTLQDGAPPVGPISR
jgi:anti-anti-sigma regulatory factor